MYDEILLTMPPKIETQQEINTIDVFQSFINRIEGWKTKCKNLHWSASKKNIHIYLDDFLNVLSDYQDGLAEEVMGIFGKFQPNMLKGSSSNVLNANDFIREIKNETLIFYNTIPQDNIYKGIASECETFIHNINKYVYLFSLCDINLY